ncbi:SIR2 family protein [Exiguobacterium sp. s57]|uniref:SIR2 family protein n=1 Tax=Exiguobacterium sp. s57 TaxID=2751258 RepID=UPI001BEA0140|nr:SIR2 family protein [Exiguobacterium sp. s57]
MLTITREIKTFLKDYVKSIQNSNAAIFAGAGLSRPAGYVDWKELLKDVAEELGLDIDQEDDLITLAQYHVNHTGGRAKINQILIDEFTKNTKPTKNHYILSNIPIETYWTTNYDQLIENCLENKGKKVDKKITATNLSHTVKGSDVTLYKMHGDSSLPDEAVLTKDDYISYDQDRLLFKTALQGDLVSKTFLFIGFSFDDPNLDQIISRLHSVLKENRRTHYCLMKKINRTFYKKSEDFQYAQIKQELRIQNLKRYGINVIELNEYEDITELLQTILALVNRKNVFVSGSAKEYGDWSEEDAFKFSTELSKALIQNGYSVVSGFGLGIGSCIISGALEELYTSHTDRIENRLISRPFPQTTTGKMNIRELWTKYRKDMLSNVGIAIFIFGNKIENGEIIDASGMVEEFELSIKNEIIPIPIGSTGFTAKKIWDKVMGDFTKYIGDEELKPLYEKLNVHTSQEEMILNIVEILNKLTKK